jgi:hypothetical protein
VIEGPRSARAVLEPDGSVTVGQVTYRRSPERVKRRTGETYVNDGAAVVTDRYPEGPLWYSGDDAKRVWQKVATHLISGKDSKPVHEYWSGHVFESDSGLLLLWLEGHH